MRQIIKLFLILTHLALGIFSFSSHCNALSNTDFQDLSNQAYSPLLDSLLHLETDKLRNEELVFHFLNIAHYANYENLDLARTYLDSSQILAKKIDYPVGIVWESYLRTYYYENMSFLDSVKWQAIETLELLEDNKSHIENNTYHEFYLDLKTMIARAYGGVEEFDLASDLYFEMLRYCNDHIQNDTALYNKKLGLIYYGLGFLYDNTDPGLAKEYFEKTIELLPSSNAELAASYYGIVSCMEELNYSSELIMPFIDSVIYYGIKLYDRWWLMEAYVAKCKFGIESLGFEKALEYCIKADEINQIFKNDKIQSEISLSTGRLYLSSGQYETALLYLYQSLSYFKAHWAEYSFGIQSTSRDIAEIYSHLNIPDSAEVYWKFHSDKLTEYYDKTLQKSYTQANIKYETEKKEAKLAQQELQIERQKYTQNLVTGGSIAGFSLLAAIFFGLYQRNSRKRRVTELALQLEQKRAEDLESLSKTKTDFFNNVSHELRTPLTLIIAPLEDVLVKTKHVEMRRDLSLALNNSKRLLSLTNEILDLSKIDASYLIPEVSIFKLNSYVNRVFHSFDSLAGTRGINLIENFQKDPTLYIQTDANKLEKIISNLVSNAIKYSNDGGNIEFIIDYNILSTGYFSFLIRDQGTGIPDNEQDLIFDRYYQSASTAHSSGTGIGLALVHELTHLLKGNIRVESIEGEGSTFYVNIPAKIIHKEQNLNNTPMNATEDPMIPPMLFGSNKPHILIVEDDPEMSKYLVSLLDKDYKCETAFNGDQAIEKLNKSHFDLITSDIMMPGMDGFEFRETMNQNPKWKSIPFIMLTARALERDRIRGLQLGIDDYIAKPFSSSEFKARIYNLLINKLERDAFQTASKEVFRYDQEFVRKAEQIVFDHLNDPNFGVESLAKGLNYSRRQLSRIIQKLTGLSPVTFILEIRLQHAYQLIRARKFSTISEVRYEVGMGSYSYFAKKFKERFGISPGELENKDF